MVRTFPLSTWAWLRRHPALVMLVVTVSGLAAGGLARLAGAGGGADAAWLAAAACGIGYSLWFTADSLRRGRVGVDAPGAVTRVRQVHDMLSREVWPHESAEETELYPSLNRVLGGTDPTAPMSRAHAEIASSGCTPCRRTRPTCRSATARTRSRWRPGAWPWRPRVGRCAPSVRRRGGGPLGAHRRVAAGAAFRRAAGRQRAAARRARTDRASLRSIGLFSNPALWWGIAFELALTGALIYLPPFQPLLGTAALPVRDLLFVTPFPFIVWGADEFRRWLVRRSFAARSPAQPSLPMTADQSGRARGGGGAHASGSRVPSIAARATSVRRRLPLRA